ncbi:hypothetical protein MRX96_033577 [Rhipicephalus microplus]
MQNIDMPPTGIDLLQRVYSNNMVATGLDTAGLVFADDLVLLAENTDQLQNLKDISAHHLASLKLTFNAKKSAVLRFSGPADERELVLPNGQPIPRSTEYRYFRVTLCDRECYDVHEAKMRQSSQRAIGTLRTDRTDTALI